LFNADGVRAVTGSTRGNIGVRNSVLKDFPARGQESLWTTRQGFWIESPKIRGESRYHRGAQAARDVEHKGTSKNSDLCEFMRV
jgi:hypothetical protein